MKKALSFLRTHKLKVGIILALGVLLWLVAPWKWTAPDTSAQLHKGYRFFDVPITKKLATSLRDCTSYKRAYSDDLFYQLWNNRAGYKAFFSLHPGSENNCIIKLEQRSGFFKPYTTLSKTSIPRALSHRVGDLFLAAFSPTPENQEEIKHFARCMQGWDSFKEDDIFAPGHFEIFTHSLEEYLEKWDKDRYQKEWERPQLERKREEQLCRKLQKKLGDVFASNPPFASLDTNKKVALVRQIRDSVSYPERRGYSLPYTGYNAAKDDGILEACSDVSCCRIKFNATGITSAQFVPQRPPSFYSELPPLCVE